MKKKVFLSILLALTALAGCRKTDPQDALQLYYMGISSIHPGETATSSPSYLGPRPSAFSITSILHNGNFFYQPKIDGPLDENSSFYIDPDSGTFKIQQSSSLKPGLYKVSIRCSAGGVEYDWPDAITIQMIKES